MKKFIVLYHAPLDFMKQMENISPGDKAKGMEAWMQWAKKCGDKLVDMGAPLMNGQQLHPDGTSKPSDKNVVGYSVLQAENLEEAKSLLQGHPHLNWNPTCSIEVHETMSMPEKC
jgi:hypothetical protein